MTLYGPLSYHKTQRVLIVAKYSGKSVEVKEETAPEGTWVPKGLAPVFQSGDCTLFDTNSIVEHFASEEIRGGDLKVEVSQCVNYIDIMVLPAVGTLVLPTLGHLPLNKGDQDRAHTTIAEQLDFLNSRLASRTFLVGERITIADITLFTVLKSLYERVLDETARKPYVHLNRWIKTVANQENVKSVVGEFHLCEVPAQFDAKKYSELHPKKDAKKAEKVEKKAEPKVEKKQEKKQEKKPKKEEEEDDDEPLVPVEKDVDPYKALPNGTFNMEEWKRIYSNNDIETVALQYFWEKLDKENYSIWTCEYLFPEELGLIFMTCNLVSGMFQRLEKLRKYAFGSMVILGKDRDNTIKGLWVWKGQDLAFPLSPDCSVDYESYKWEKLDSSAESTKALVKSYFLHEGDFGDKAFNQGKIFK